jgi:hypothetical protein
VAKFRGVFLFLTQSSIIGLAAAAAIFCIFAAGAAIGTADAFAAFFLLLPDIKSGKSHYYSNDCDYNNIFHNDCSFLLFFYYFAVFSFAATQR